MSYPRPQLQRSSFLSLDGQWDLKLDSGLCKINVPFSPEAQLSGVPRQMHLIRNLEYRRVFQIPKGFSKGRVLINFGAVDQICTVKVNSITVGSHEGGYLGFSFDITEALKDGYNELCVIVADDLEKTGYGRGKQTDKPRTIWYTAQSGIWQSVWLESVPDIYISKIRITPLFDQKAVEITVFSQASKTGEFSMPDHSMSFITNRPFKVYGDFESWTPDNPVLHYFTLKLGLDTVTSYFAMRKFSTDGHRLCLNNKPLFHSGVLDQGYWPDGLYTAPSEQALEFDIKAMKALGFNTLRKHIKVEPLLWYHMCDKLGMLVWQDMPSGGGPYKHPIVTWPVITQMSISDSFYKLFGRKNESQKQAYRKELAEMIDYLYNTPCIAMWVPFNEGWGQFDAKEAVQLIQQIDTTRTIDHASGWHDQGIGPFESRHIYFKPYVYRKPRKKRIAILSEFGGYNLAMENHTYNNVSYGYKDISGTSDLEKAFADLYFSQILKAKKQGLAACIYTQLSDVETETNGLYTYDRKVLKIDANLVRELNRLLLEEESQS